MIRIETRANRGESRLASGAECKRCGRQIKARQYKVLIMQTSKMPVPAFFYYHTNCRPHLTPTLPV